MSAVLIHGAFGNPGENWFPWLRTELQVLGQTVHAPSLPTPEGQSLDAWFAAFDDQGCTLTTDTVLIGHSLGPAFILALLERSDSPVAGCFLVSAFARLLGIGEFDDVNSTFVDRDFDWDKIRSNAGRVTVYNSDNDPYVPLDYGADVAQRLDGRFVVLSEAGHVNSSGGYDEFPVLLEDVRSLLAE